MNGKEFYSVKEIAQILNLSPDRIYEYLRAGRLHGARLSNNSAWRIPASELQRLKGSGSAESSAPSESRWGSWSDAFDMTAQLQGSLSRIGSKDWAIWGLPDTGEPPSTSEAELGAWIDRGKLTVKLKVEQDRRFPVFLDRLKSRFPEFSSYDQWRESLTDFFQMCYAVAHEIWSKAESETGLDLGAISVMDKGHLINVPQFIYEFALDNYASGNQPELEILQNSHGYCSLVPKGVASYILAGGSRDEMEQCQGITISLASQYTVDKRIGEIRSRAAEIAKQTTPFVTALSAILKEAMADS